MKAADKMVDVIRDIIQQEIDKQDCVILCEILSQKDANHYDVYVLPDKNNKITNIANMTKFEFTPGDYCYVYKIQNNLANSFICSKVAPGTEAAVAKVDIAVTDILNASY